MKRHLIPSCVALLIAAAPTAAYVQQGDTDLEILGGWGIENAEDAGTGDAFLSGATGGEYSGWLVTGGLGHFISDNLQVAVAGFGGWLGDNGVTATLPLVAGFAPGFNQAYEVDVDTTVYGLGGRLRWHFAPENRVIPYVGAQAFYAWADVDISGSFSIVDADGNVVPGQSGTTSEQSSDSGILCGPLVGLRWELSESNDLLVEGQYHFWVGDIGDVLQDGYALFIGISHQIH